MTGSAYSRSGGRRTGMVEEYEVRREQSTMPSSVPDTPEVCGEFNWRLHTQVFDGLGHEGGAIGCAGGR